MKRFGNKVNLRELERVVMELNFVRNCIALWNAEGHKLCLCLSATRAKGEFSYLKSDVMSHLKTLPAIYKPDKIIIIERFDLTNSGKICLASLRKICRDYSQSDVVGTSDLHDNADKIFGNIWDQHIKSKDADFLASGGTSITALQISNAAAEAFKMDFPELIGMLLKDASFDNCVNYIKNTLTSRDCSESSNRSIDVSLDDVLAQKTFNAEKSVIKRTAWDNFPVFINQDHSYQWYKCRGQIYGDTSMQKQSTRSLLANVSSIEVLATYNLQKCVDASPIVYCYSG